VLSQLAQLAAAQQIRPAVADVHQGGQGAGPQHRRQGCDRLVIVLGEAAHHTVGLGDRLGQHGEQSPADAPDSSNGLRASMAAALASAPPGPCPPSATANNHSLA
jgi:hypothetical protein